MSSLIIAGLGLRNNIKIPNPNTSMQSIFEDFCKKNGINPVEHALFDPRTKKAIDLTLPFRLSGFVQKATLEVRKVKRGRKKKKRRNALCKIALATPEGRFIHKIPVSSSILEVLFLMEKEHNVNLNTRKSDENVFLQPVVVFMQRKFGNLEQLSSTKLINLGIKKNQAVMLRLSYTPNKGLDPESYIQMITGIRDDFLSDENAKTPVTPSSSSTSQSDFATTTTTKVKKPPPPDKQQEQVKKKKFEVEEAEELEGEGGDDDEDNSVLGKVVPLKGLKCRDVKIYRFGSGEKTSLDDIDDQEFEPSLRDLKFFPMENNEEEHLKTRRMREVEASKKRRKFLECMIRVRFRNGLLLQGTFSPKDTLEDVADMVRSILVVRPPNSPSQQSFQFHVAPPVRKFREDEMGLTLEHLNLVPAVMLNITCTSPDGKEYFEFRENLVKEYLQDLQDEVIPENVLKKRKRKNDEKGSNNNQKKLKVDDGNDLNQVQQPRQQRGGSKTRFTTSGKKVPKWLGIGKK